MTSLTKLGFRRQRTSLREIFGPPGPPPKRLKAVSPDVDFPVHDERTPQAQNFSHMWIDEFRNIGNIQNPLASPMESGA